MEWILVADTAHARILSTPGNVQKAKQVESFDNGVARMHGMDLTDDKPGRVYDGSSGHGGSAEMVDPKDTAQWEFARKLANALNVGRNNGSYERLTLVAPPQFLGLIKKALDPVTEKTVKASYGKDLAQQPTPELIKHLEKLMM